MRKLFILLAFLPFAACTKSTDTARLNEEFQQICSAHQAYLETRKLKGVDEAELLVERDRRMREGLTLEAANKAAEAAGTPANPNMRERVETLAREAGLKDWSCPALSDK